MSLFALSLCFGTWNSLNHKMNFYYFSFIIFLKVYVFYLFTFKRKSDYQLKFTEYVLGAEMLFAAGWWGRSSWVFSLMEMLPEPHAQNRACWFPHNEVQGCTKIMDVTFPIPVGQMQVSSLPLSQSGLFHWPNVLHLLPMGCEGGKGVIFAQPGGFDPLSPFAAIRTISLCFLCNLKVI